MGKLHKLTDMTLRRFNKKGFLSDGGGLGLQITDQGHKSWVFRYSRNWINNGNERRKGLGGYPEVSLILARTEAENCRQLLSQHIDPIEESRRQNNKNQATKNIHKTFKQCAEEYIEKNRDSWKNSKHRYQWTQSLTTYVFTSIGTMSIQDIETTHIESVLNPVWTTKTETATRLRQRMEAIFDYAIAMKMRAGSNPARWRGNLKNILPEPAKLKPVKHQPAMPYAEIPDFYKELRRKRSLSAYCLSLIIQTATRSSESRMAQWCEFDMNNRVWKIPAARTRSGKHHNVPITEEIISILKAAEPYRQDSYVFPGLGHSATISDSAVREALQKTHSEYTVHGFRSAFRDWCAEQTNFQSEISKKALGHMLESRVDAAYQQGILFEKRVTLMNTWSKYCLGESIETQVTAVHKSDIY